MPELLQSADFRYAICFVSIIVVTAGYIKHSLKKMIRNNKTAAEQKIGVHTEKKNKQAEGK